MDNTAGEPCVAPAHKILIEWGNETYRYYGSERRRIASIRCSCGADPSKLGVLSDTTLSREILGIVRGRIAVTSYDVNDESGTRIVCYGCLAERDIDCEVEVDLDYTVDSRANFDTAKALEQRGDSHTPCCCSEEELAANHGIRWVSISEPEFKPNPKDRNDTSHYDATPYIRGWFDARMRCFAVCPDCDGSLLRKLSQTVVDGRKAAQNLQRSA